LGDLYFEVGLYAQAEENYQAALAAAEANADLSAQAAAHLGLARVAHAFDEIEAALEHLSAAETLYQQAGQPELADQVAMERDKLQKQID
jgi:tetratricopeptide (TPR) repeat protein